MASSVEQQLLARSVVQMAKAQWRNCPQTLTFYRVVVWSRLMQLPGWCPSGGTTCGKALGRQPPQSCMPLEWFTTPDPARDQHRSRSWQPDHEQANARCSYRRQALPCAARAPTPAGGRDADCPPKPRLAEDVGSSGWTGTRSSISIAQQVSPRCPRGAVVPQAPAEPSNGAALVERAIHFFAKRRSGAGKQAGDRTPAVRGCPSGA